MSLRQRLRPMITALLLFIHLHSIVFFVGLLCVASKDLSNTTTTTQLSLINSTHAIKANVSTTTIKIPLNSSTTAESIDEQGETTVDWRNFNIRHANNEELQAYKNYLESELSNVTELLNGPDKKSKRYIPLPVSSSLPDHISSDFVLNRFNATSSQKIDAKKGSKKANESEILADENKKHTDGESENADQNEHETKDDDSSNESDVKQLAIVREDENIKESTNDSVSTTSSSKHHKAFGIQTTHLTDNQQPDDDEPQNRRSSFEPTQNRTIEECKRLTQDELVKELKQKGSYNPNLMAWDVAGVFRFLDRSIVDQYERQIKSHRSNKQAVQRNVEALERILTELNLQCDVRTPEILSRLSNLTLTEPRRTIMSPSIRMSEDEVRFKRHSLVDDFIRSFNNSRLKDEPPSQTPKNKKIGEMHVVPFGCDKRGEEEDGYLRLCGTCQAIRKLPDNFFPPFINEVICDEDKGCLYFYDYPHGKCKQKHMNFVVLRNVGTPQCQVWQKFNLNVRVSCECFVDEQSFFAKYV